MGRTFFLWVNDAIPDFKLERKREQKIVSGFLIFLIGHRPSFKNYIHIQVYYEIFL